MFGGEDELRKKLRIVFMIIWPTRYLNVLDCENFLTNCITMLYVLVLLSTGLISSYKTDMPLWKLTIKLINLDTDATRQALEYCARFDSVANSLDKLLNGVHK